MMMMMMMMMDDDDSAISIILAVKIRNGLPFRYWLAEVVLE